MVVGTLAVMKACKFLFTRGRVVACLVLLLSTVANAQVPAGGNRPAQVPGDYVITPFGYFHPSCVRHLASGDNLLHQGLLIRHSDGTFSAAAACQYPHYTARGEVVSPGPKTDPPTIGHSWIVDAETTTSTSYGEIASNWTVPSPPTSNDGQTVYLFPGLEDFNVGATILQPVLGWNADFSGAWGLASWDCCPSGTANESMPLHVNTGDPIFGEVRSTCSAGTLTCPTWNVTSEDTNIYTIQFSSTTLSNTPDEGQTFNWAFGGALEVYNVTQCSDYPPNDALVFGTTLYDNNFNLVPPPAWSIVDRAGGLTPQCNYGGQIPSGDIALIFGDGASLSPTGMYFGTYDISQGPVSRTFTLTNYGASSITISSIGGLTDPFSVGGTTCGSTLGAGATCSITVTLTPSNAGGAETDTSTLAVDDSAPNSSQIAIVTAIITCSHNEC